MSDNPTTTPAPTVPAVIDKTPVAIGVPATDLESLYRLARAMARSELLPKEFRGKPDDVMVAVQWGSELGLKPMQALQSIAVVNGRPGLFGDGLLAVVMASALYVDHEEYFDVSGERRPIVSPEDLKLDSTMAVCRFTRRDKATPIVRSFSMGQARRAKLANKPGPWQEYPDRMLQMRARSLAARDAFPDVLRGIRMVEELRDLEPEAPRPIVHRLSERAEPAPKPFLGGHGPAIDITEDVLGRDLDRDGE